MLVSREELRFDFQGGRFDLGKASDRRLLAWIFHQFLYGEVTGIQCGHWLYRAPHLNAAAFLAKQAGEELSHVKKILRILSLLGEKPGPAHWVVRLLSTGMMGKSWGEHVALEMALGEGLVLGVFYAMEDTIDHPEIHKILESATIEEERHVEFGERETQLWLKEHPRARKHLLGLALVQVWALKRLRFFISKRFASGENAGHPVLGRIGLFFDHGLLQFERRIERIGLSEVPLSRMSGLERAWLAGTLPFRHFLGRLRRPSRLLTSTYLEDPAVLGESQRFHPPG